LRRRIDALNAPTAHISPQKPLRWRHFHQTNNVMIKVPMD
jgi:hypothetical protein